jgi:hypothetical protein
MKAPLHLGTGRRRPDVPIIQPVPLEALSPSSRSIIEAGVEQGLYSTPVPLQLFAYRTALLESMHAKRLARGADSLLGGRILELLRIRSAQLGACQPCMQSRKHASITDADVARPATKWTSRACCCTSWGTLSVSATMTTAW